MTYFNDRPDFLAYHIHTIDVTAMKVKKKVENIVN